MVKVKICANKSVDDAGISLGAGADIIGILVGQEHTSSDFVDKQTAKDICDFVAHRCRTALVTHLTNAKEIIDLTRFVGNDMLQLHSRIAENEVAEIKKALPNVEIIRLLSLDENGKPLYDYSEDMIADYFLTDSVDKSSGKIGGTGKTYNIENACDVVKKQNKPVFVAGGLNYKNVKSVIDIASPFGVDVNSGCKNESGVKDELLVRKFIAQAKWQDVKMVIFDFDSTLYTGKVWENWGEYLTNFVKTHVKNSEKQDKILSVPFNNKSDSSEVVVRLRENDEPAEMFVDYTVKHIYNHTTTDVSVVDLDKLQNLKKQYKLSVVSNSSKTYVEKYLNDFGIDCSLFDHILQNDFLESDMSKAVCYKSIMDKEKLSPSQVLVVGDNYYNDLIPAKKLGYNICQVKGVESTNQVIDVLLGLKG